MTLRRVLRSALKWWKALRRSGDKFPLESDRARTKLVEILRGPSQYNRLKDKMVFSNTDQVYWLQDAGERTGPFCPYCFRMRRELTELTPAISKGVFFCALHQVTFKTAEYQERLGRYSELNGASR